MCTISKTAIGCQRVDVFKGVLYAVVDTPRSEFPHARCVDDDATGRCNDEFTMNGRMAASTI